MERNFKMKLEKTEKTKFFKKIFVILNIDRNK